jgi:hypothetical protein
MTQAKVAVGIPLYGYVPAYVYYRHIRWSIECSIATREIQGIIASENCYLPWARRDIVNDALKDQFTHVFFLDQDVIVPAGTIRRLLAHRKPVVGALYYQKVKGHEPVAGNFDDNELGWSPLSTIKNAIMRVDMIGLGATLVDTDVFRKLGDDMAWFDMNARTGEDIEFCRRVTNAGFSIYVDPTIDTQHVGATPVTRDYRGVGI